MALPYSMYSATSKDIGQEWVELINLGKDTVDIGIYHLSDDRKVPDKYSVPINTKIAGGACFVVYNEDLFKYTGRGFKLNSGGEKLFLFNRNKQLIDSLIYPKQYHGISFGYSGEGGEPGYFRTRSPGKANVAEVYLAFSEPPVVAPAGGFYSSAKQISITTKGKGIIRYTLDGSVPDEKSKIFFKAFRADSILILRARVFEKDKLPSPVITHTYFINISHQLPVFSLVTDPDNFFDDKIGIYVDGTNGVAGNCNTTPKNFNQSWKRPLNIEFFDAKKNVINQEAEVRIFGNCSRRWPQKSLLISAKEKYGKDKFKYRFFSDKEINKFKSVMLRNSGTDWNKTLMKDAFVQSITRDRMDLDQQAYRASVIYINGVYWGIYNIREMMDDHYIRSNHNIELDDIDMIENITLLKYGKRNDFNFLKDTLSKMGFENDSSLLIMDKYVDLDNFMDYHIAQLYSANTDWPNNNIRYWKARNDTAKWRYMLYDTDMAFGSMAYTLNPYIKLRTEKHRGMNFFVELLKNPTFCFQFSQRFAVQIYTTYDPGRLNSILDSIVKIIEPEVEHHFERWGGSKAEWQKHLNVIVDFAKNRQEQMMGFLQEENKLRAPVQVSMSTVNGRIILADVEVGNDFKGKLFPGLIRIEAKPDTGYSFSHWEGGRVENGILIIPETVDLNLKPVFKRTN